MSQFKKFQSQLKSNLISRFG